MSTLFINIGELVTCEALAIEKRVSNISEKDLGILSDAWLYLDEGKVLDYGLMSEQKYHQENKKVQVYDLEGKLMTPGLVDSHTHCLFAGNRSQEFKERLAGKSYQEIASNGGGIQSTVFSSRQSSSQELEALAITRLKRLAQLGITTVEVKSGYGLSVSEELRHLRVLNQISSKTASHIVITCLALHAFPPRQELSKEDYIKDVITHLIPTVAREKLARYVDAFIEEGYYSVEDCHEYVNTSKKLGLDLRLHVDEFSDCSGALAAAQWSAVSADHLQHASEAGISAMAKKGVIATLLPGTSLYTHIPFVQAQAFIQAGCGVAIASDYNPGSCQIYNLPLLTTVAALHCGMTMAQAFAAVTFVPAFSLGLAREKGALCRGWDGDLLIHEVQTLAEWFTDCGQTKPKEVWIKGKKLDD